MADKWKTTEKKGVSKEGSEKPEIFSVESFHRLDTEFSGPALLKEEADCGKMALVTLNKPDLPTF